LADFGKLMNARKALIAILTLSLVIEILWPVFGFLAPTFLLELFKMTPTPDLHFLAFVISWCLLFVALVCGYALRQVLRNQPSGWTLSYILGFWWVGIGFSLFFAYGKLENLFLDGVKGALIVAATYASRGVARA
jgi:Na+-driven multidrug efflux pump